MAEDREVEALSAFRRVAGLLGLVAVPIGLLMAVYADEVAQLAFRRGECGDACVTETAEPLLFYALGMWPAFLSLLLNRTLSASNRQRDILVVTGVTVALTIVLDVLLLGPMEQAGLALAATLGVYANATMLLARLRRHHPALSLGGLAGRQVRVLAAGGLAAGAALLMDLALPTGDLDSLEMLPPLGAKLAVAALAFVLAARTLARPELAEGVRSLRAVTRRGGSR
jgi:putative peptidoglycan lipid II flippase